MRRMTAMYRPDPPWKDSRGLPRALREALEEAEVASPVWYSGRLNESRPMPPAKDTASDGPSPRERRPQR